MSVMMLMKERIAIPMFFPASAASSSSWATFLTTSYNNNTESCVKFLLDVIPELPKRRPELHHVLRDGVEVLESAVDVTRALIEIQSVVQDHLVARIAVIFL